MKMLIDFLNYLIILLIDLMAAGFNADVDLEKYNLFEIAFGLSIYFAIAIVLIYFGKKMKQKRKSKKNRTS